MRVEDEEFYLSLCKFARKITVIDKWPPSSYKDNLDKETIFKKFRNSGIDYQELDLMEPPPFSDQRFDLIIFTDVIEHLPRSPKKLLNEFNRILKPNGYLIVSTPNVSNLKHRIEMIFGRHFYFPIESWFNSDDFVGHFREYTSKELRYIIENSNFEIRKILFSNSQLLDFEKFPYLKLNSVKNILVLLYVMITSLFPSLRNFIILVAKKIPIK